MASRSISEPRAGVAALLLGVVSISWGSILVRLCVSPPLTIACGRLIFASILIGPWVLLKVGPGRPPRRALAAAGGAGCVLALHFAAWVASLAYTTIAASTLLVSTAPVFSLLLSHLVLGERPRRGSVLGVLLALAGAAVVVSGDLFTGPGRLSGDLLALAGAICAAVYLVVGRAVRERLPFAYYFFLVNLAAAAAAGVLAAAWGQSPLPSGRRDLAWLILMAIGPQILGHGALNWAVRRLHAYVANLAVLGEPILASLYGWLIFRESPPPAIYPGALLIAAGVMTAILAEPARERRPAAL